MLVFLRNFPTRVRRGSFSDLEHRAARLVQVLDLPLALGRIRHHGPELVQAKPSLVEADALLNEEGLARAR